MKHVPYPAYQDTGLPWLGKIPTHWGIVSLKRAIAYHIGAIKTGPFGSQLLSSDMTEGEVKVYNQRNVIDNDFSSGDNYISLEKYKELESFTAFAGDVLVTTRGTIGRCAILPNDAKLGILHPCLLRVQPHTQKLLADYLILLIQDSSLLQVQLLLLSNATTIDVIYSDTMKKMIIPLPPLDEQKEIVQYGKTISAKIDALIAKKQRLLELLAEKRAALISRAVTKGLNPEVEMINGNKWLDSYPHDWTGTNLKRWVSTKITDGPHETPVFLTEGVPFVSAEAVYNGRINFNSKRAYISLEEHIRYSKKLKPQRDDIFMVKSGATTGKLAIVDTDIEFNVWSPMTLIRVCRRKITPQFMFFTLNSDYVQDQVKQLWSQGTQPNISMGEVENIFIVAPNLEEQERICEHLDRETIIIDSLTAKVETAIDSLREYRSALISAAVTGKFQVPQEA